MNCPILVIHGMDDEFWIDPMVNSCGSSIKRSMNLCGLKKGTPFGRESRKHIGRIILQRDKATCILEGKFFLKFYFNLVLIYFVSLDVFIISLINST